MNNLTNVINKKLDRIGEIVVNNLKDDFNNIIGRPTKTAENFFYVIKDGEVNVYSKTPIPKFVDEGTKPHIIRAKTSKGLLFRVEGQVTGKKGHKFNDGDWVRTMEVNHPGTIARPFIEMSLFLSKREIMNIFKGEINTPTLHFVAEGK